MELKEYQEKAMSTCMLSCNNIAYMLTNLVGEVGEFSSKIAKLIRKEEYEIYLNSGNFVRGVELRRELDVKLELAKELGDILWQLSGLCSVLGFDLEKIAQMNLDKLASRKARGKIEGEGDNR